MTTSKQQARYATLFTNLSLIKKANGFNLDVVRVLRGIRGLSDFNGDLPGLSIYKPVVDNVANQYGGTQSEMFLNIWGFAKVEARLNDYTQLDSLVADVEKLVVSVEYNPYLGETFISKTTFYEGGIQDNFGFFNMELKLVFDHELADV